MYSAKLINLFSLTLTGRFLLGVLVKSSIDFMDMDSAAFLILSEGQTSSCLQRLTAYMKFFCACDCAGIVHLLSR